MPANMVKPVPNQKVKWWTYGVGKSHTWQMWYTCAYNIRNKLWLINASKIPMVHLHKTLWELSPPDTLTRGSAPGSYWGHIPDPDNIPPIPAFPQTYSVWISQPHLYQTKPSHLKIWQCIIPMQDFFLNEQLLLIKSGWLWNSWMVWYNAFKYLLLMTWKITATT